MGLASLLTAIHLPDKKRMQLTFFFSFCRRFVLTDRFDQNHDVPGGHPVPMGGLDSAGENAGSNVRRLHGERSAGT